MATILQKKALDNLVANGGRVRKAMRDANYSPATAKTPKKLTESKGFQELMKQYGLTYGLVAKSLVEDIKAKPQNRKPELDLAADILKMKGDKEVSGVFVPIQVIVQTYGTNTEDSQSAS